MSVASNTKRRLKTDSTTDLDLSIKYPYAFTHMSISPYGRDAVLGGRAGLAIVDLNYPLSPPRTIPIESKWKIAGVEWCPNTQYHGWIATAANQTLLIHDLAYAAGTKLTTSTDNDSKPLRVIKAHPMSITDIAWASLTPAWIATSSIEPLIKIWDIRCGQQPVWIYAEWESADILAFNNVQQHKLASVHRNKIAVWDIRYGSSPLNTLDEAHTDDITSISWHPTQEDVLVSSSKDHTVKRWCVKRGKQALEYTHKLPFEVLSVEYTPFGEHLLVTQRSPDNIAILVRDSPQLSIVHQFVGHLDTILASGWRSYRQETAEEDKEFQLVTWSKDLTMRMWPIKNTPIDTSTDHPIICKQNYIGEEPPSFATNFLGPDQILHLYEQNCLSSDLILAAARSKGGSSNKVMTMHELKSTGLLSSEGIVDKGHHGASKDSETAMADHSSDDEEYDDHYQGRGRVIPSPIKWSDEMDDIIGHKYQSSKTVVIGDVNHDMKSCILKVGIPWLTHETLDLQLHFPEGYPSTPLEFKIESCGLIYGNRELIYDKLRDITEACAAQGIGALDNCLYGLLPLLIISSRSKDSTILSSLKADDLERLPPPPSHALHRGAKTGRGGGGISTQRHRSSRKYNSGGGGAEPLTSSDRSRSRSTKRSSNDQRLVPDSFSSDDNFSILSPHFDDEEDGYGNAMVGYDDILGYPDDDDNHDSDDEDGEDYDKDDYDEFDELDYGGIGLNVYSIDSNMRAGMTAADLNDLPASLRHANSRERYDIYTPFPRLCGGVFSGPGKLLCFFASIYTPDTYPDQGGLDQQQGPVATANSREKHRADMTQQLKTIVKPRNFSKIKYYQRIVQIGLQNSGAYISYGYGMTSGNDNNNSLGGRGQASYASDNGNIHVPNSSEFGQFGDSDNDEDEPRFYYRQHINRGVISPGDSDVSDSKTYFHATPASRLDAGGVGNIAMICHVREDRSADLILAQQYVLTGPNAKWICEHNGQVAELNSRGDLAHVWRLLACLLSSSPVCLDPNGGGNEAEELRAAASMGGKRLWMTHPSILKWLRSVMRYYEHRGDVQTLALLACVLRIAMSEASTDVSNREQQEKHVVSDLPPWMKATGGNAILLPAIMNKTKNKVSLGTSQPKLEASRSSSSAYVDNATRKSSYSADHYDNDNAQQRTVSFMLPQQPVSTSGTISLHNNDKRNDPVVATEDTFAIAPVISTIDTVLEREVPGVQQQQQAAKVEDDSVVLSDVLCELDSEEIKQNELMMAEGLDKILKTIHDEENPSEVQTGNNSPVTDSNDSHHHHNQQQQQQQQQPQTSRSELHRTGSDNQLNNISRRGKSADDDISRRNSSDQHQNNERSMSAGPADAPESNLWDRLRSNVISRVQTVGGYGGGGNKDTVKASASEDDKNKQGKSVDRESNAVRLKRLRRGKMQRRMPLLSNRSQTNMWIPLLGGKEDVEHQAIMKEAMYQQVKQGFTRPHTRMVTKDSTEWEDDVDMARTVDYRSQAPYLDHWKVLYSRALYMWQLDERAVEVLKLLQDPVLLATYTSQQCQPTMPQHDNWPRSGIAANASPKTALKLAKLQNPKDDYDQTEQQLVKRKNQDRETSAISELNSSERTDTDFTVDIAGAPWLSCSYCHEYVHGRALICHACGHGGHQTHMLSWFRSARKLLVSKRLLPGHCFPSSSKSNSNSSSSSNLKLSGSELSPVMAMESSEGSGRRSTLPDLMLTIMKESSPVASNGIDNNNDDDPMGSATSSDSGRFGSLALPHMWDAGNRSDSYHRHGEGWGSSDVESDDHLQLTSPTPYRKMYVRQQQDEEQSESDCYYYYYSRLSRGSNIEDDSEEYMLPQLEIPTCPTGCGCNCVYSSSKLVL